MRMRKFIKDNDNSQWNNNHRRSNSTITLLDPDLKRIPQPFQTHKSKQCVEPRHTRIGIVFEGENDIVYHQMPRGKDPATMPAVKRHS